MAFVIADRVRETTTTIGTGSITLAGAYTSFQSFSAAIGNGNNTYYTIASASSGEWEVGIGTYSSGGNLLSRDTVLSSSNAGNLVNFSVGSKDVFVTQPSERSLLINAASNGLFAGNAAFTANGVPYANSTTTLTTGSALTFDGSFYLGLTGAMKINSNGYKLRFYDATGATGYGYLYTDGTNFQFDSGNTQPLSFLINGTEGMRLTSTGLGIGTSSPSVKLDVAGAISATAQLTVNTADGANQIRLQTAGVTKWVNYTVSDSLRWYNSADRMTLDSSGNLGIGTSSPGARLHVDSGSTGLMSLLNSTNANGGYITGQSSSTAVWDLGTAKQALNVGGASDFGINVRSGFLSLGTGNTERMRLDSSGNLGLGVTPSAWGSGFTAFQLGNGGIWKSGSRSVDWIVNGYYNGTNYIYNQTAAATYYRQYDGQHLWFNAPSGTAGNAITFTQAMTLDASGNLGIGTSSPATNARLHVYATGDYTDESAPFTLGNSATGGVRLYAGVNNTNDYSYIGSVKSGTRYNSLVLQPNGGNLGLGVTPSAWATVVPAIQLGSAGAFLAAQGSSTNVRMGVNAYYNGGYLYTINGAASMYQQAAGVHSWHTAASGTAGNAITFTQAMTLDASGNLLVRATSALGSASSRGNITVNGATDAILSFGNADSLAGYILQDSGGMTILSAGATYQRFYTNGTERARITSGGNLLVGTTSFSFSSNGVQIGADGRVWNTSNIDYNFELAGSTGNRIRFYTSAGGSGATVGSITVSTTATAYNTSSDYRLKDNAQPLTGSGAFIDALQPKTWDWKDIGGKGVGFIAHEVQEISPGSVVGAKDAVDAEGNPVMQAMEYGSAEFIANIVAELQSLRARVAQLETKGA